MRTRLIFQKYQIKFSFSIWDYKLIYVKRISNIKKGVFFINIRAVRFVADKIMISLLKRIYLQP
jgi:hypothetical protein